MGAHATLEYIIWRDVGRILWGKKMMDSGNSATTQIIAEYQWSEDAYRESRRQNLRAQVRRPFRYAFYFVSSLILAAGIWGLYADKALPSAMVLTLIGAYLLVFRRVEARYFAKRRFQQRSDKNKEIRWQFRPDDIHVEVSDLGDSNISWAAFEKAVRTKDGIVLYSAGGVHHWLPNYAVASPSTIDDLWKLLQIKVIKCQIAS